MDYTSEFRRSIHTDLQECASTLSREQLLAICNRDYLQASKLGVSLNKYLITISDRYKRKLQQLL